MVVSVRAKHLGLISQSGFGWLCGVSLRALVASLSLSLTTPTVAESLRQAMAAAYQSNPKLDAERAKLRATDEDVSRAESGYRPTIQGSADLGRQNTVSKPVFPSSASRTTTK